MEKTGSQSHQETLFETIQEPRLRDVLQNNWPMLLKNGKVFIGRIFQIKEK